MLYFQTLIYKEEITNSWKNGIYCLEIPENLPRLYFLVIAKNLDKDE